jgi:outer membrane protein
MLRSQGLRGLCVLSFAVLAASTAFAQAKVAVLNTQAALLETAEIKKAQADMEAKFKPRQEQMAKLQKELETIQQQLQTLGDKLTPQAQSDLTTQSQRKQRDFQRMDEDMRADVERERNDILTKSGDRMQLVVNKLAEEKGLDLVIDASNTAYFKPALEITKDATAAYDKAYPVKK